MRTSLLSVFFVLGLENLQNERDGQKHGAVRQDQGRNSGLTVAGERRTRQKTGRVTLDEGVRVVAGCSRKTSTTSPSRLEELVSHDDGDRI